MTDERKAFEAWYESPTRPFCESDTSAWGAAWAAWQARAALSAPPREPTEAMTAMAMELRKHAKWISEDGRPLNSATPLIRAASLLESLAAPAIPAPSAPAREAGAPVAWLYDWWGKKELHFAPPSVTHPCPTGDAKPLYTAPATGVVEALRELVAVFDRVDPGGDFDVALERARAALAGQDKGTL
jgi:hypothetical protein